MMLSFRTTLFSSTVFFLLIGVSSSFAETKAQSFPPDSTSTAVATSQDEAASSQPVAASKVDPFASLMILIPRDKLPSIRSIRIRDAKEQEDRSREDNITINVGSSPTGCIVSYGGKALGKTPLKLNAKKGSTPLDVAIQCKKYMILRTRLWRIDTHSYFFKLSPAKIR